MACPKPPRDMFVEGNWMDAIICWLTAGGDPGLTALITLMIYGTVLTAYFIVGKSPLIPFVVSIILSGVIFTSFPAGAMRIALVLILIVPSVAGLILTWRFGQ